MNKSAGHRRLNAILMSDPRAVILERWDTEVHDAHVYLTGYVYGHPETADGTHIISARVMWMLDDVGIAQTATRNYILRNRR